VVIDEPSGVMNTDKIKLIMRGHKYSTLISRKIFIADSSGIANLDVMMLIVGGHVYSTL
jgi:hypothetical protein